MSLGLKCSEALQLLNSGGQRADYPVTHLLIITALSLSKGLHSAPCDKSGNTHAYQCAFRGRPRTSCSCLTTDQRAACATDHALNGGSGVSPRCYSTAQRRLMWAQEPSSWNTFALNPVWPQQMQMQILISHHRDLRSLESKSYCSLETAPRGWRCQARLEVGRKVRVSPADFPSCSSSIQSARQL